MSNKPEAITVEYIQESEISTDRGINILNKRRMLPESFDFDFERTCDKENSQFLKSQLDLMDKFL